MSLAQRSTVIGIMEVQLSLSFLTRSTSRTHLICDVFKWKLTQVGLQIVLYN